MVQGYVPEKTVTSQWGWELGEKKLKLQNHALNWCNFNSGDQCKLHIGDWIKESHV